MQNLGGQTKSIMAFSELAYNCENLSFTEKFVLISRSLKHTHFLYERLTNRLSQPTTM